MASVRKKIAGKQEYYYLEHSFRERGKIQKKEKYLGKTLPDNLEELKQQIIAETYRDKWLDLFDKIKKEYSVREKTTPTSVREKEIENFIIKFTYDTNRIEGSKLTFRETSLLLEKGITPNEKTLRDVKEAEAHRNAFYEMLSYEKELSLNTILYFHKKLFDGTKKDIAEKLRQHQVAISGSRFMPPFPVEVYPLLMDFFRWYGKNKDHMHPVELAALVHLKLATIHPFADGNGRISRLIMNFVLRRHGFPMLNIPYEKRSGYYNALEKSQVKKDEAIFLQWLFKRYLNEHRQYLKTCSNGKHNVIY